MNSQTNTKQTKVRPNKKTAERAENISAMKHWTSKHTKWRSRHFISGSFEKVASREFIIFAEELGTMPKNNLREITLVRRPIWRLHSLPLIISCFQPIIIQNYDVLFALVLHFLHWYYTFCTGVTLELHCSQPIIISNFFIIRKSPYTDISHAFSLVSVLGKVDWIHIHVLWDINHVADKYLPVEKPDFAPLLYLGDDT